MIRQVHPFSWPNPFEAVNCADLSDVAVNAADVMDTLQRVTSFYERVIAAGVRPLTAGGDHLVSLPVLRAVAKDKPLGMIHFDAHTDSFSLYFGDYKYTHETRFCRAVEKGFLDPKKVLKIGIRGTG